MSTISYRTLFIVLLAGMGIVLLAGFLKSNHMAGADIVVILGLAIQAVAGIMMVWKFASRLDKSE
jgi:DNA-binding transcriptional LysR family regulator